MSIGRSEKALAAIIALVALLPGLGALFNVLPVPPSERELLRTAIGATSIVAAIFAYLVAPTLSRWNNRKFATLILVSFLVGAVGLLAYFQFHERPTVVCTIRGEDRQISTPIFAGPIQKEIEKSAINLCSAAYIRPELAMEMKDRNEFNGLFLAIALTIGQFFLTLAIVLGGYRLALSEPETDEPAPAATPTRIEANDEADEPPVG